MTDVLVQLAPEWVLLLGGCLVLVVGAGASPAGYRSVAPLSLIVVLIALVASINLGRPENNPLLPGLLLTPLTFYTRCITLAVGALVVLVNWRQSVPEERGEYMSLILFSLLGVLITASANDLILLFLALELVSVPTYVLIALSRLDGRASESAVKYFFLGALAAAILAYGLSFLYGAAGTTTLVALDDPATPRFPTPLSGEALIGLLLVFGGLAFKVAAVPLHVYVADVYEGAAAPISGMLGFVPKAAGFIALVKILAACHWTLPDALNWMMWAVAAATMTAGNVLALLQSNVKRVLAYSSIAHSGYMLVALLVGPAAGYGPMRDGVAAILFYVAVYGVMNLGAFVVLSAFGTEEKELDTFDDLAGLSRRHPLGALGLTVCALSLMGIPPTAGFIGKVYIFSSAFSLEPAHPFHTPLIWLAVIGVLNTAVGAAYYLRIVMAAYIREPLIEAPAPPAAPPRWGLALCSIPMIALFIWPTLLTRPARHATIAMRAGPERHDVAGERRAFNPRGASEAALRTERTPPDDHTKMPHSRPDGFSTGDKPRVIDDR